MKVDPDFDVVHPRTADTVGTANDRPVAGGAARVVGLDLSLTGTGMSDGERTWLVRSSGKADASLPMRVRRLGGLRGEVLAACDGAGLVVIEQPAFSRQTGHMHDRSGLWWLVVADLHDRGVPVAEVAPTALKLFATGKGNASKSQVVDATARRLPGIDTGADDNRCDALWLAAMGLEHLGCPLVELPAAQRAAVRRVAWPTAVAA